LPPADDGTAYALTATLEASILPSLSGVHWPSDAYPRTELPERVLQFGTGMLLRALCAASVDAANRAGAFNGRIVVVQSTTQGNSRTLNAQDGLFTLVERGLDNGAAVERTRLIGSVSRALLADGEWEAVREIAARPELQVIVSNVTEAGFRLEGPFPARLTDVLRARFERLPDSPPLFVIPTELIPDNGPQLAAMVNEVVKKNGSDAFQTWLSTHVRFCSSLVDRIVTAPPADAHAAFEATLGYHDALLTVTEPYALWAIEADPAELRAVLPMESASVVFAPDIAFYRERKLRLLNAVHTATVPLALLAGVRTVREAATHPLLGPFQERLLFDEIIPATDLPADQARAFAHQVLERFANPWLEHEYRVIATNQLDKFKIRVVPLIITSFRTRVLAEPALQGTDKQRAPCLALAAAAHLTFTGASLESLSEAAHNPEFAAATTRWMEVLTREGAEAALETLRCT
jgi:tagaturonate reductase